MSLLEINWHPGRKELRGFGIAALVAGALVSVLLYALKGLAIEWVAAIFAAGCAIFLSSLMSMKLTRAIYLGLVLVTLPIGWVVSFVLLAVFYFLLISPLSLVFRLIGRDPLHRKFDAGTDSYWVTHRSPEDLERYFHQF